MMQPVRWNDKDSTTSCSFFKAVTSVLSSLCFQSAEVFDQRKSGYTNKHRLGSFFSECVCACVCLTLQLCACAPEAGHRAVDQEAGQHAGQAVPGEAVAPQVGAQHRTVV